MSGAMIELDPEPSSVRAARRFIDEWLSAEGFEGAAGTAQLLVSELVTNAVLHARTRLWLTVECNGDTVRVGVGDGSSRAPTRRFHSTESGTGRGLMLVDKMATRWGVDRSPAGKVVWFELPREPVDDLSAWDDVWEA